MAYNPFLAALEARSRAEDDEDNKSITQDIASGNPFLQALASRDEEQKAYAKRQEKARMQQLAAEEKKKKESEGNQKNIFLRATDALVEGVTSSYKRLGGGIAESAAFNTETQKDARAAQDKLVESNLELGKRLIAKMKDPKTSKAEKERIKKVLSQIEGVNTETWQEQDRRSKEIIEKTDPVKGAAAVGSIGFDLLTLGTVGGAAKAGTVGLGRRIASGAAQGAVSGGLGAVENEGADVGFEDIAKGAGFGAAVGGALTGAGGVLGDWIARRAETKQLARAAAETDIINSQMDTAAGKAIQALDAEDAYKASQGITDPSRLLPDGSQSKAARVAEIEDELNAMSNNAGDNLPRTKSGKLDVRNTAVKNRKTKAQTLMEERQKLLDEIAAIKDPNQRLAEEYIAAEAKVEGARRTGNQKKIDSATREQEFMAEQARLQDNQQTSQAVLSGELAPDGSVPLKTGEQRVAGQADSIELAAIKKGFVDSIEDKAMYGTVSWDDQFARAKIDADADPDLAIRIATGEELPPPGMLRNAYTEVVRNQAEATGNVDVIEALARGEGASMTSRAAQELGILGAAAKDRNSAVAAIMRVNRIADKVNKSKSGIGQKVTKLQAEELTRLYRQAKILAQDVSTPKQREIYAKAFIKARDYEQSLIDNMRPKGAAAVIKAPKKLERLSGLVKTAVTTLDNSVIGRQGWKTAFTYPKDWAAKSLKSFADIVRTVGGKEVLREVRTTNSAEPLFIDGTFQKMGLDLMDLGLQHEEAFPVDLGKVKGLGVLRRFPKAANDAYTAWHQRMRVSLAKVELSRAAQKGVDITDPNELKKIGEYVNTVTSRGKLKTLGKSADTLNNYFFSPKLMRSNFDYLTAMRKQDTSPYVRRRAAENLLKTAVGSATSLALASAVLGGKTELDPRSSDFGKLRIGDTRFDFTGGMGSFITLLARGASIPAEMAGLTSGSTKSSITGELKPLMGDGFGAKNYTDVLVDFFQNKASPLAGIGVDIANGGKDFEGNKITPKSIAADLTIPLIIRDYDELKGHPRAANAMVAMIASGLGISTNTYSLDSNWNATNSKRVDGFKKAVSKGSFEEANKKFNLEFEDWYDGLSATDTFWKLPIDKRERLVTKKKDQLTNDIMARYGYKYKQNRTKDENDRLADTLLKITQ